MHRYAKTYKDRPEVILGAFIEYVNDFFKKTRAEAKSRGREIANPRFFEQGRFVSLEGFDRHGNIVYRETQPGTDESFEFHIISIACPYSDYKPYHDRWAREGLIEAKLESIGI